MSAENVSLIVIEAIEVYQNQSKCLLDSVEQAEQLYLKLSTFWYCFLALITTVGLIVSLVSNMIIVYLFSRFPSLWKNPSNIIAANLSLSDLLYCSQWPSVIYCSITQSTWILEYDFVCQSFGFITVSTALASILTVLVISVERAIVIVYSIHAKHYLTIKFSWFIILLIWIVSVASCIPPLFGKFNRYTLDPSKTSCTLDYLSSQSNYKLYILVLYVAYWIVPAAIILISYALIIVTFKKSSLSLKEVERSDSLRELKTETLNPKRSGSKKFRRKLQDSIKLNRFIGSLSSGPSQRRKNEAKEEQISTRGTRSGIRRASASLLEVKTQKNENGIKEKQNLALIPAAGNRLKMLKRSLSNSVLVAISARETTTKIISIDQKLGKNKESLVNLGMIRVSSIRSCQINLKANTLNEFRSNLSSILIRNSTRQRTSELRNSLTASISANSKRNRTIMQFRLAKMSFYLILLWLVSWTPIASLSMLNSVTQCYKTSATAIFLASTMTKLGPTFDVFIYGISHPKIKSRFKNIMKQIIMLLTLRRKKRSNATSLHYSLKHLDTQSYSRTDKMARNLLI